APPLRALWRRSNAGSFHRSWLREDSRYPSARRERRRRSGASSGNRLRGPRARVFPGSRQNQHQSEYKHFALFIAGSGRRCDKTAPMDQVQRGFVVPLVVAVGLALPPVVAFADAPACAPACDHLIGLAKEMAAEMEKSGAKVKRSDEDPRPRCLADCGAGRL